VKHAALKPDCIKCGRNEEYENEVSRKKMKRIYLSVKERKKRGVLSVKRRRRKIQV